MEFKVGDKVKLNALGALFVELLYDNKGGDYKGEIVEITENPYSACYLVKFPKGFDGHDGNGLSKKVYEDRNVVFLPDSALELIEDEDELTIDEMIKALIEMFGDVSEDGEEFAPYIVTKGVSGTVNRGNIGEETTLVDCNGSKLFIGDIVQVDGRVISTSTIVAKIKDTGVPCVMGISHQDGTVDKDFKVTKLIDHSIAHDYLDILDVPFEVKYVMEANND